MGIGDDEPVIGAHHGIAERCLARGGTAENAERIAEGADGIVVAPGAEIDRPDHLPPGAILGMGGEMRLDLGDQRLHVGLVEGRIEAAAERLVRPFR